MMLKSKRLRDPAYLKSFRYAPCMACGVKDDTVVAAHIRAGFGGGMGLKPDDDLTLPLCGNCHADQHRVGEIKFWADWFRLRANLTELLKTYARFRYVEWKGTQK